MRAVTPSYGSMAEVGNMLLAQAHAWSVFRECRNLSRNPGHAAV